MDLDQLLASLQASAADDPADPYLLAVSDYEQGAQSRSWAAMRAAHFYVGCLGHQAVPLSLSIILACTEGQPGFVAPTTVDRPTGSTP